MGSGFNTLLSNMEQMGFFQFLFPFLLALALVYGLLEFTMKEKLSKSARGLIALIIAFFVMLYSSWNVMIVSFFTNMSGLFLIVGSGILFVILLLGLVDFRAKDLWKEGKAKWAVALLVVAIGIVIFISAGGAYFINLPMNSEFYTIIFFVVILALVIFWLGQEGEKEPGSAPADKPS